MTLQSLSLLKKITLVGCFALAVSLSGLSIGIVYAEDGETGGGCGGCGEGGGGTTDPNNPSPPPAPLPPSCSLVVSPASILSGEAATLTWNSTNVDYTDVHSVLASFGDDITAASYPPYITDYGRPWGSAVVHPTYSRTYTVTFFGPGGNITCSGTITVGTPPPPPPPVPPSCTISANPTKVKSGENSTLTWTSQDATTASLNQNIGSVPVNGNKVVGPLTATTTYTLTVTGNGTATCSTEVGVIPPPPPPPPPPSCIIAANPSSVPYKGNTTLTWSSQNADAASIDQNIGSVPVNGSRSITYLTTTKTYTLTVQGTGGTATCATTVTVIPKPKPPTCTLSANPSTVKPGESSVLSWTSQNATSVSIDQGIGSVAVNGSQSTPSITKETKFTLTAANDMGSVQCYVTIKLKSSCTTSYYSRYSSCR